MQSLRAGITIVGRALRLRCPRCDEGQFLEQGFATRQVCEVCGLRFDREEGYWTGAVYVNLIATQFLIVSGLLVMIFGIDLGLWREILILVAAGAIFPFAFYPFSKSLWLGMDYFFADPPPRRSQSRSLDS